MRGLRKEPKPVGFDRERSIAPNVRATRVPVAGNPPQEMVEAAFAEAELDFRYVSWEVRPDALREAVLGVRTLGFGGVHITVPHKVAVVPLLDE